MALFAALMAYTYTDGASKPRELAFFPLFVSLAYGLSRQTLDSEHHLLAHATFRYIGYWWIVVALQDVAPSIEVFTTHSVVYWSHVLLCRPGHYGLGCGAVLALGTFSVWLGEALGKVT